MMQLPDYIGKTDFEMIHFSLSLIKDVDYKMKTNTFFYKNQVIRYINEKIEHFLKSMHVTRSLRTICKAEIHQMITPKINKMYDKYCLFSCL